MSLYEGRRGILKKVSEGRAAGERTKGTPASASAEVEQYEGLCADLGQQPADVALALAVDASRRSPYRLIDRATASSSTRTSPHSDLELDDKTLNNVELVRWTGPEAYAW